MQFAFAERQIRDKPDICFDTHSVGQSYVFMFFYFAELNQSHVYTVHVRHENWESITQTSALPVMTSPTFLSNTSGTAGILNNDSQNKECPAIS